MSDFKRVTKYSNADVLYDPEAGVMHIWTQEDGKDIQLGVFYVREEDATSPEQPDDL